MSLSRRNIVKYKKLSDKLSHKNDKIALTSNRAAEMQKYLAGLKSVVNFESEDFALWLAAGTLQARHTTKLKIFYINP